jgi:hypothetical protein
LPVWHTHSTVTGSATSLGIDASGQTPSYVADKQKEIQDKATDHQRGLADYYANLEEDEDEDEEDQSVALNKVDMPVKAEQVDTPSGGGMVIDGGDEDDGDMEETETPAAAPETNQVMVMGESYATLPFQPRADTQSRVNQNLSTRSRQRTRRT